MRQRRRGAGGGGVLAVVGVVAVLFVAIAALRACAPRSGPPPGSSAARARRGAAAPPNAAPNAPPDESPAALRAARPPILPDTALTPGAALAATARDVCVPGYSKRVRNVPQSVKRRAYAEYGIATREPGEYEVDHLISLELGGSNSLRNLWPESFRTQPWNARTKDRLENELHRLVCAGQLDLAAAQEEIAGNWVAAYRRRFGAPPAGAGRAPGRERGGR